LRTTGPEAGESYATLEGHYYRLSRPSALLSTLRLQELQARPGGGAGLICRIVLKVGSANHLDCGHATIASDVGCRRSVACGFDGALLGYTDWPARQRYERFGAGRHARIREGSDANER
jgi:hypothetical protein